MHGNPNTPISDESLDRETREFVEDRESKIRELAIGMPQFPFAYPRPTTMEIVMMGGFLCDIKTDLGHGKFIDWVKAECPFSYRTAHRYMRAYRGYCVLTKSANVSDFGKG